MTAKQEIQSSPVLVDETQAGKLRSVATETVYDIRDAHGVLIAQHVRKDKPNGEKSVRWKSPDGTWGLKGVPLADLPLYGTELVSALGLDELIVLTEGEKARDALEAIGCPAVASVTGASSTPGAAALEVLKDRRVCLWPDNDSLGHDHMMRIGEALFGVAAEVLMFSWKDAPVKGDAADHPLVLSPQSKLDDRLLNSLEDAPQWTPYLAFDECPFETRYPDTIFETVTESIPIATPFPTDVLPMGASSLIDEAALAIGCPPELIGVWTLATLSAGIGASRVVELKPGWQESTTLYLATVSPPSTKKTPAAKVATTPAWKMQRKLRSEYKVAQEQYKIEKQQWEAKKRSASRNDQPAPDSPDEPMIARTIVENTTVEALAVILESNPRGVLNAPDELSAWAHGMNQYKGGKGADRQFWLSAWSNRFISIDRKGRSEPIIVPLPFVSVVGGIQPRILPEIADRREDGLLDRFLWAYPSTTHSKLTDHEISSESSKQYESLYNKLMRLEMQVSEEGDFAPRVVSLSKDAWELFKELSNQLREETQVIGFPSRLEGVWSKMEAYLARIALILALCRCVTVGSRERVETIDVLNAWILIDYFKVHARRVYASLQGSSIEDLVAARIASFLTMCGGEWKGEPSELHAELLKINGEGIPERPDELSKILYALSERSSWLNAERKWTKDKHGSSSRLICLRLQKFESGVVGVAT